MSLISPCGEARRPRGPHRGSPSASGSPVSVDTRLPDSSRGSEPLGLLAGWIWSPGSCRCAVSEPIDRFSSISAWWPLSRPREDLRRASTLLGFPVPCWLLKRSFALGFSAALTWIPRATFPQLEGAVTSSSMARVAHVARTGTPQHGHPSSRSSVTWGLRCC